MKSHDILRRFLFQSESGRGKLFRGHLETVAFHELEAVVLNSLLYEPLLMNIQLNIIFQRQDDLEALGPSRDLSGVGG